MTNIFTNIFIYLSDLLNYIFFFEIFGFPFLVIWLMCAGIFLSFKLGFPNFKLFKHAVKVGFLGKYNESKAPGEMTPQQSLFTAISGTVGLGNISGVAIAVTVGGPGAVIWMMINAFFGMNTIFTETVLSQTYREVKPDGKVNGGPFRYLKFGLADIGFKKTGIFLSLFYSILFILGSVGAAMFQVNQAIVSLTDFPIFSNFGLIFAILAACLAFYILISGAPTLGKILGKLVPIMAATYILGILTILIMSFNQIPNAILIMIKDAFGIESVIGGFVGTLAMGIKRSGYSSEAGMGTTSIAHSVAKTTEPVRQGAVASLTPSIDTILFCTLTGLAIVTTGAYKASGEGVLITKQAFLTVSTWFPIILSAIIIMFGLSTMISYSFYGQSTWRSLFKNKGVFVFNIVFSLSMIVASFMDLKTVVQVSDTFFLSIAIPNLIGVYMLSGIVKKKLDIYLEKLNNGEFDKIENSNKNK